MQLSGKNVVYVGGFGGIGYATCKDLLAKGISVLIIIDLCENKAKLQELSSINRQAKIGFSALNLCHGKAAIEETLKKVVKEIGHIDILVNGSGIINDRQVKLTVDINLLGLIETTIAAVPLMSKAEGGRGGLVVNIASVLGLTPGPFLCVYTATKHGIVGFTRACADQHYYDVTGIQHIAICPGATVTGILEKFVGVDTFEFSKPLSEKVITAKNQTAEECAKSVIHAIEHATNGSVWLCDLGKVEQVKMHDYWQYQY